MSLYSCFLFGIVLNFYGVLTDPDFCPATFLPGAQEVTDPNICCNHTDLGTSKCLSCYESWQVSSQQCFNGRTCSMTMDVNSFTTIGYNVGGCEYCMLYKLAFTTEISRSCQRKYQKVKFCDKVGCLFNQTVQNVPFDFMCCCNNTDGCNSDFILYNFFMA
uniref:Uncharacterized protein n=1 Tax=Acrobeloides nanus TaxID=290746 RepID=A0A914CK43_9BILA